MNGYDFNDAEQQFNFDPIPDKTIASLRMDIQAGGFGEGGWLTPSKSSDAVMLSCEFCVLGGPYDRRKLFQYLTLSGGKLNAQGESVSGNISRSTLRAILESARGVDPADMSEQAMAKRRITGWQDFCGLVFTARIGIEKGRDGYEARNKIAAVITPDMKEYLKPVNDSLSRSPIPVRTAGSPGTSGSIPHWAG